MTLMRAADVSLSFGSRVLFDNIEFVIEAGEHIGLLGVNGCGKSTLIKILAGEQKPDSGLIQMQRNIRMTYLAQEPTFPEGATVQSELEVAVAPLREAIARHAELSELLGSDSSDKVLEELGSLSEKIERLGGWDTGHEARTLLDKLGVHEWERKVSELSGGQQKRVAIARALLSRPDLLMLDEPTNHLDAETVGWLEETLDNFEGALILVTHDRYFLDGLVERIIEVEPPNGPEGGGLRSYPGNYESYMEQKLVRIGQAETSEHKRGRWIEQEVAWLRRGPQARRTKSKARIERAQKLLGEKGFQRPKVAQLQLASAPRLSQTVIEADKISQRFGDRELFRNVSLIMQPGERIGIVGKNGAGKTTLLRTLLGDLPPSKGTVRLGPKTRIAYFDQTRTELDEEATVAEAVWHDEWVTLGNQKVRLQNYLEDLLFPVSVQRMKVRALSGGERNRLLLAKLFLSGANVLVLDEPTNDLDLVTLNILERLLIEFTGAVLLVTHDRYFLDKVATSILFVEGDAPGVPGSVVRYEGNFSMFMKLKAKGPGALPAVVQSAQKVELPSAAPQKQAARLGFKEQRELDGMEKTIEVAEAKKAQLESELANPAVFSNASKLSELTAALDVATKEVEKFYARWDFLVAKTGTS
jgi:ABC transport system ATP-binding/permease protein